MWDFEEVVESKAVSAMIVPVIVGATIVWSASRWSLLLKEGRMSLAAAVSWVGLFVALVSFLSPWGPPGAQGLQLLGVINLTCLTLGLLLLQKGRRTLLAGISIAVHSCMLTIVLLVLWTYRG
jgi:hypothetical protein